MATTTGKYYFEATIVSAGICRVGWSSVAASLDLGTDNYVRQPHTSQVVALTTS